MAKLVIVDGTVVDPSQGLHGKMDVLVEDGRVVDIQKSIPVRLAEQVINAAGLVVAPGFIDLHTHLREPGGEGAETIETGSMAAARGGFTTIFCMPNTDPVNDSVTGIQYVLSRSAAVGRVRVIPIAAVTVGQKGESLTNFGKLQSVGAGAFSDDGRPIMNAETMRRALEYTRMLNVPIFEHCEDLNLSGNGVMNEGRTSLRLGLKGIPRVSESVMVARNVSLAQATGGHIHICHVSTRESVEAIREAKRNGVRVTAEVTPHHLTMTEKDVAHFDTHAKMKPPLCEEDDRRELVAALEDGTIDCIATDHAPHSANAKKNVFDQAPFGIIGMETAFPLLYTEFVAPGRWTLEFLVEKLTTAPAAVMNENWGTFAMQSAADLVLLQVDAPSVFEQEHLASKSVNCPWIGREMQARVAGTLVAGKPVYTSPDVFPKGIFGQKPKSPDPSAGGKAKTSKSTARKTRKK